MSNSGIWSSQSESTLHIPWEKLHLPMIASAYSAYPRVGLQIATRSLSCTSITQVSRGPNQSAVKMGPCVWNTQTLSKPKLVGRKAFQNMLSTSDQLGPIGLVFRFSACQLSMACLIATACHSHAACLWSSTASHWLLQQLPECSLLCHKCPWRPKNALSFRCLMTGWNMAFKQFKAI